MPTVTLVTMQPTSDDIQNYADIKILSLLLSVNGPLMLNSGLLCLNKPENKKELGCLCTKDVFPKDFPGCKLQKQEGTNILFGQIFQKNACK